MRNARITTKRQHHDTVEIQTKLIIFLMITDRRTDLIILAKNVSCFMYLMLLLLTFTFVLTIFLCYEHASISLSRHLFYFA